MSTGGPDLFVICKSCGSEVSPYITECPYCGNRLRKRAPKIDREGRISQRKRRRPPSAVLPRLRRGEIPGIRGESRPYMTMGLVALGAIGCLVWRPGLVNLGQLEVYGKPGSHWWRLVTAAFTYQNTLYAFAVLATIMLFGWLLERRHGRAVPLALFVLGGIGGIAATAAAYPTPFVMGANGAALAMVCAWAVPDLLAMRGGEEIEADMIGVAVIAAVVALMPLAVIESSWIAGAVGVLVGFGIGVPLARTAPR
ncbi:MAG: rhomboid family intramembrane serine protease [Solirubrobacterales bacterium]|nr:rhomboid family intramembrane serine protease [Solirubrobacterales bacterium]